jgi:orotate phosphoribosyltransferase
MLDAREVLVEYNGVFLDRGCLFVSTTGKFLTGYVNCEVLFPHYEVMQPLVAQLVEPFLGEVEGFICPQTGDIALLQYANILANRRGHPTTAVWADKHSDNSYRVERNGFEDAIRGRKVVVVNDRISQGGTTLKVVAEARRLECEVLGVATIAGVTAASAEMLGVPRLHALSIIDVQAFPPEEIPVAFDYLPIAVDEALGHGADFQRDHPDYPGSFIKLLD